MGSGEGVGRDPESSEVLNDVKGLNVEGESLPLLPPPSVGPGFGRVIIPVWPPEQVSPSGQHPSLSSQKKLVLR